MNCPTAKHIAEHCNVDIDIAKQVRGIMQGKTAANTILPESWYRQFYHQPSKLQAKLEAINQLLGTYGVEYFKTRRAEYEYCNSGDTYVETIIYCVTRQTWILSSWGDIVEREG